MKIGILGTGIVGQTLASALAAKRHDVTIGTRDPAETLARAAGGRGQSSFREWHAANPAVHVATFADAARAGDVALNATSGQGALGALAAAGDDALGGRILVDISNPLDFSRGMPPSLSVSNTDSLGEQIQRAYPRARVVKALNTVTAPLMVDPQALAGGEHTLFICGNDAGAKRQVTGWLGEWFGWRDVLDVGDITAARGTEQLLPLWVRLMMTLGTPMFSFKVVR